MSPDDIEVEEKKSKLYRLPNGIEFYVLDDLLEAETEGKLSARDLGGEASRSTKRVTHALIVNDPSYGTIPYDVWQDKMRETVMGTLRTDKNIPHADVPHSDSISVTASSDIQSGVTCKQCGKLIPFNLSRCPSCGTHSPLVG